jgi:SEC-C motif
MAGPGRNERCPCGSGRKVKRCCGVRRGPSEDELAKAFLAVEAPAAAWVLRDHDDEQLDELHDALIDLPSLDPSLLWPLPRLLPPELVRLGAALADEDADTEAVGALLPGVLAGLDTPRARAGLARVVLALRDGGRLPTELAAAAVIDLASPSTTLVRASVLHAVAVDAGAVPTASGLVVATAGGAVTG